MFTVEDYIKTLSELKLESSDYSLVFSFARQIAKGIPFTDRQCELAKNKIIHYTSVLEEHGCEVNDLSQLRMPLRSIDRSRWVRIVDSPFDDTELWIGVRFIFQKRLISQIEKLTSILEP